MRLVKVSEDNWINADRITSIERKKIGSREIFVAVVDGKRFDLKIGSEQIIGFLSRVEKNEQFWAG